MAPRQRGNEPQPAPFVKGVSSNPDVALDYQALPVPDHDNIWLLDQKAPQAAVSIC